MSLIEEILSIENLNEAIKRVKANKGASGIDKMSVDKLEPYFNEHRKEIIESIMTKEDKSNKKLKIILIPLNIKEQNSKKEILCPECFEPCKCYINNYRINLSHCSGLHNIDNIKLFLHIIYSLQ